MPAADRHAEVISLDEGRQARASRTAAAARATTRRRCAATTAEGHPCRNYAVDGDRCRVHARSSTSTPAAGAATASTRTAPAPAGTGTGAARVTATGAAADAAATTPSGTAPDAAAAGTAADAARAAATTTSRDGRGTASDDDEPALPPGAVDGFALLRELGDRALGEVLPNVVSLLRRRLTGDYDIDDFGFDEDLTTNVLMPLLRPLHRSYWRVASYGADHLPREGGGLVVANHAGTLPADALMTRFDIFEATGRHARELGADLVFRTPFVGELARKTGATLASGDDADRLLAAGELVAVWPEGYKGLGKPWRDRYKLQRFGRGGFVATALRAQVPIVPTAIVGSEEIYPLVFDLRVVARALGLPYFPVVAQSLALPILGPFALLPLPSRWIIEYGEPIDTTDLGPEAADDPMVLFDLADQVRDRIQGMLHRNLMGRRSVFL